MVVNKHLKQVHGLIAEKAKPWRPSTFERVPWHQNNVKMNICFLGDAIIM
jgi:hypothetical protein